MYSLTTRAVQVVEASMLSAMNDEQGDDEMHCGNETLAAFMLHHCMHVSLNGYPKLNPFRCPPPP